MLLDDTFLYFRNFFLPCSYLIYITFTTINKNKGDLVGYVKTIEPQGADQLL
jgi:hypothetical protein